MAARPSCHDNVGSGVGLGEEIRRGRKGACEEKGTEIMPPGVWVQRSTIDRIVRLTEEGYTQVEISRKFGLKPSGVQSILARERRRSEHAI